MTELSLALLNKVDWTAIELKVGVILGLLFRRKAENIVRKARSVAPVGRLRERAAKKSDGEQKALSGETK